MKGSAQKKILFRKSPAPKKEIAIPLTFPDKIHLIKVKDKKDRPILIFHPKNQPNFIHKGSAPERYILKRHVGEKIKPKKFLTDDSIRDSKLTRDSKSIRDSKDIFFPQRPLQKGLYVKGKIKIKIRASPPKENAFHFPRQKALTNEVKVHLDLPLISTNTEGNETKNFFRLKKANDNEKVKLKSSHTDFNNKDESASQSYFVKEEPNLEWRKTMEDFIYANQRFYSDKNLRVSLYAVFDGFGGDEVAKYLKMYMPEMLLQKLKKYKFNIEKGIEETFSEMSTKVEGLPSSKECGSTGTVALVVNDVLFTANVGNSGSFLIGREKCLKLTRDHECTDEKEVARIKSKEGAIFNGRVFGQLSLTRCFGATDYKNYGVHSIPSCSKTKVAHNQFCVIASDGVWNFYKEKQIQKMIREKNYSPKELCEKIVSNSLESGSNDNISCIVLKF